jgi:hypothetical protein
MASAPAVYTVHVRLHVAASIAAAAGAATTVVVVVVESLSPALCHRATLPAPPQKPRVQLVFERGAACALGTPSRLACCTHTSWSQYCFGQGVATAIRHPVRNSRPCAEQLLDDSLLLKSLRLLCAQRHEDSSSWGSVPLCGNALKATLARSGVGTIAYERVSTLRRQR